MRRAWRTRPVSVPANEWFYPDSLVAVQGLVKSALYAPGPKASTGWPPETDAGTREETERHGPVLRRGQ